MFTGSSGRPRYDISREQLEFVVQKRFRTAETELFFSVVFSNSESRTVITPHTLMASASLQLVNIIFFLNLNLVVTNEIHFLPSHFTSLFDNPQNNSSH